MTPQLMQAIKLLQLSNLDLAAYVEGELERNPLLERASEGDAPTPERSPDDAIPAAEGEAPAGEYSSQNLISEDLEEVFEIADRIAVMFEGRILDTVPVAEADVARIGLLMAGAEGRA